MSRQKKYMIQLPGNAENVDENVAPTGLCGFEPQSKSCCVISFVPGKGDPVQALRALLRNHLPAQPQESDS